MNVAITTILAILAFVLVIKRKEWFLGAVCVITGIFLATTEMGQDVTKTIISIGTTVNGFFS